jgi:hypothetical protein
VSTLQGRTVASTYKDLLQISNNNIGVDTSVRYIEDGEGTPSVLGLSTSIVEVAGPIIPDVTLTRDLGSNTRRFRDLYLSGTTIHLGDQQLNQGMIQTIKDVQEGAYATSAQGSLADTALQPGSHINFIDVVDRPNTLAGYGIADGATKTYVDNAIVNSQGTTNWSNITGTPSTLLGYGITDAATSAQGLLADSALQPGDNILFEYIDEKPSTLLGYGITDAATSAQGLLADSALQPGDVDFSDINNTPSTLAGYGITDAATSAQGLLADSALQISDLTFNNIKNTPSTLAGYGITDAATLSQGNKADSALQPGDTINFVWISNTPTTLAGYGITDAATTQYVDDSIVASQGTNDWSNITGTPTTIAGYGITDAFDGNFSSLIGRPTTIAGYGITDAFDGDFNNLINTPTTIAGYGITDAFDGDFNSLQNKTDAYLYTNIKTANASTTNHVVFADTVGDRQVCVDPGSFAYDDGTKTLTVVNLNVTTGIEYAGAPLQLFDGNFNSLQNKTDAYELTRTQEFLDAKEHFMIFSTASAGDEVVSTDPDNFKYDTSTGTLLVSNLDATGNILINGTPVGTGSFDGNFNSLTNLPNTLAGYGIVDAFDGFFNSLSNIPATLAGYGITDAINVNDPGDIVPANNMTNTLGTLANHWNNVYTHDLWVHNLIETNLIEASTINSNNATITSLTYTTGVSDTLSLSQHLQTGLIQNTANITIDPAGDSSSQGKVIVLGDLDVRGTTTTIDSTTLSISGKNITLAQGATAPSDAELAGLNIDGAGVNFVYDSTNDSMSLNKTISVDGDIDLTGNLKVNGQNAVFSNWSTIDDSVYRSTGNVGIGTTNPIKALHVAADGHHFVLEDTNAAAGERMRGIYNNNNGLHFARYPDDFNDSYTDLFIGNTGNVGIGTTSPNYNLDILRQTGGDAVNINCQNDFSGIRLTSSSGAWSLRTSVADDMFVYDIDNASQVVTFKRGGNVGIGTTTPENMLHVSGTGHTKVLTEGGENHAVGFQIKQNLIDPVDQTVSAQIWQLQTKAGTNALQIRNATNPGNITAGNIDMHFDGNGNVGIGTDDPRAKLDVNFTLDDDTTGQTNHFRYRRNIDDTDIASGLAVYSGGTSTEARKQQVYLNLATRDPSLGSEHGGSAWMVYSTPEAQGTYGTGQIDFYLRHSSPYVPPNHPGFSELQQYYMPSIFTIKSDGKLGAGTSEPRGALDLRNNTHHWMSFGYKDVDAGHHQLRWDSSKVYLMADYEGTVGSSGVGLGVDGAITLWQTAGGNTFIGEQNNGTSPVPNEKLYVQGAVRLDSVASPQSTSGGTLWYNSAAGANGAFLYRDHAGSTRVLDGTLTYNFSGTVWSAGATAGKIHYSLGHVGIAHNDPGEAMAVKGNIFSWNDTGPTYHYLGNASNHRDGYVGRPDTGVVSFGRFVSSPGWLESARFDIDGLFGINTTAPIAQLHLKDGVTMSSGWRRMLTLEAAHPAIQFKGTQQQLKSAWIGLDDATSTEGLQFRTGGVDDQLTSSNLAMSIDQNGNVAIGGLNHAISPLHVQGDVSVTSGSIGVSGHIYTNLVGGATRCGITSNNGEGGYVQIESRSSTDTSTMFGIPIAGQSYLRSANTDLIVGSTNNIAFAPNNSINFYYDVDSWYVESHFMPGNNMVYNIGSVDQHWDNIYSHDFWVHNLVVFSTGEQIGSPQVTQWNNTTTNLQTLEIEHDQLNSVVNTFSAEWNTHTDISELNTVVSSNSAGWNNHTNTDAIVEDLSSLTTLVSSNSAGWNNHTNTDAIVEDLDLLTTTVSSNSASWGEPKVHSRTVASGSTISLANGASDNVDITGVAKSYLLMKIGTSDAAWVTIYTDSTSRANDATRNDTTDPTPGSGVIAEVITSGNVTQMITPGVIGFNNDNPAIDTVYARVVNRSGSTSTITVDLTFLQLED